MKMHQVFSSAFFNFEFLRLLSTAHSQGCSVGEALTTAATISDLDLESWSREFAALAARVEHNASEAALSGDVVAARAAYLRASNYWRASMFMLNDRPGARDTRVRPRAEKCRDCFRKGLRLVDECQMRELAIPYERNTEMPAYLYLPRQENRVAGRVPIIVNLNGGDSIQEELYFICPSAGPRLGYAVLTFDRPGQGMMLRTEQLPMRPDYEAVTGKVLDFLNQYAEENQELELDLERIAVVGASMGAYFALRAAVDIRFKACVSIDPPYDMWELATSRLPRWFLNGWTSGWITDGMFNGLVAAISRLNSQFRWEIGHMMWTFGLGTPADAMRNLHLFTLRLAGGQEYVQRIQCPVMVTGAEGSMYFKPELSTLRVYDALEQLKDSEKTCWIAKDVMDGGLQAKVGAFEVSNQRTFGWLDEHLGIRRDPLLIQP